VVVSSLLIILVDVFLILCAAEIYRQHGRVHDVPGVSRPVFLRINVNPVLRFLISKVKPQETQHFPATCN
jgi:hypothetical protein